MAEDQSILETGTKLAKEAGTTIGVEGSLPGEGKPGDVTASVTTTGSTKWFQWGVGAWFKRTFQRGGTSAGVKGEIKF